MSEDFSTYLAGFRPGSLLATYRLEAEVGAGGMAVVFRAHDERLGRTVALKILAPALAADSAYRRRFIGESRAAAVVEDPHIIPVYEAGEASGVLFIAMRFVPGGDLRRLLDREGPLAPGRAIEFVFQVASALDAAHRAGLVHRDVKPANILVDASADRPDHVYLSDFGVSKRTTSTAALTGAGQFLGTAVYSAPEQIMGRDVDGRTDQYALACVTYQLLTGVVPFERDQEMAVLYAHLSDPPPLLSARRPDLPRAADEVLARAMAKVPEKRYGTCQEFAAALSAALSGTPSYPGSATTAPMLATPTPTAQLTHSGQAGDTTTQAVSPPGGIDGRPGPTVSWTQRHRPLLIASACAIVAAAVVIPLLVTSLAKSPNPINSPSPVNPPSPVKSSSPANAQTYNRVSIDLPAANSSNSVSSLTFSPSGTTLAIADQDICLWDIASSACTTASSLTLEDAVAFSPDGKTLAFGDVTGRIAVWNAAANKQIATFADPSSKGVESVAFGRAGPTLAAGDFNGSTYLWNVATGKLAATFTDPGSKGVESVAFARGGQTLAVGDFNGSTYLWNVAAGKVAATFTDPASKGVDSVAFSPDDKTLAAGDADGSTYLWNVATGKLAATFTDPRRRGVDAVAFSPDGTTLAAGDADGSTYLWNIASGTLAAILTDPNSENINSVAFSPNGKTLATGDESGSVNLWHIT